MKGSLTRGVLFVHTSPRALCPHIEWAATDVLGYPVKLVWTAQPAAPDFVRCEVAWTGPIGTGAKLTSALRGWDHLRFEVTEEATASTDGSRWSHTPELGIFHAQMDTCGNTVVPEDRIRQAMFESKNDQEFRSRLSLALGTAWDEELEPFRYAGDGVPVRWLHRVG
ncbi:hypothetical protein BK816_05205 [Boudabousia tangfeifanii]|uniref:DUF3145 domain-containing protein n=1 Tax=Boudabousia tangfeifanii TaxID=1912795 RepID=A0A1D9MKR0_9ACTO|nr:DUF3145 domain-containing protein [Boudabousia tangfeifanii]AOZ72763.1 hypothetical protein BK816_05205 [Boudabousia tangfeifanii]